MNKQHILIACILILCMPYSLHAHLVSIKTPQEYQEKIVASTKPVVIKYFAPWCHACAQIVKAFETVSNAPEFAGTVLFAQINIDECASCTNDHAVNSIPTIRFMEHGICVHEQVGVKNPKQFEQELTQKIRTTFDLHQHTAQSEQPSYLARTTNFMLASLDSSSQCVRSCLRTVIGSTLECTTQLLAWAKNSLVSTLA